MNPITYATELVRQHYTFTLDVAGSNNDRVIYWRFRRIIIKGNKHDPRTRLDHGKAFYSLLTGVKVVTDHVNGGVAYYVPTALFESYQTALLSVGLNPDAEKWQMNERHSPWVIVRPKLFQPAAVLQRLTGRLAEVDPVAAKRTAGILKARQTRYQNQARREALARANLSAAAEKVADQQTNQFLDVFLSVPSPLTPS